MINLNNGNFVYNLVQSQAKTFTVCKEMIYYEMSELYMSGRRWIKWDELHTFKRDL